MVTSSSALFEASIATVGSFGTRMPRVYVAVVNIAGGKIAGASAFAAARGRRNTSVWGAGFAMLDRGRDIICLCCCGYN